MASCRIVEMVGASSLKSVFPLFGVSCSVIPGLLAGGTAQASVAPEAREVGRGDK